MIEASGHDRYFRQDYRRFQQQGIYTARSGIRWHLLEPQPGRYDFSSVLPMLRSAREMGMQIIWDLHHYGTPDGIDPFKPQFVDRFARMAGQFARLVACETDQTLFICPVNEISFFSWGGGDVAYMNPFAHGRGFELKVQLARAAIAAIEAVWDVLPGSRIVHVDPVIHIAARPDHPEDAADAEGHRLAQYQGWDLISGRIWPQVGGSAKYLDILGLNYYHNNQWQLHGPRMDRFHPLYRPFHQILREVSERYERPIFIAETGIEDEARPEWLRYIMGDVRRALQHGVNIEGVCLYPILNHPGWDDDRHCHNGLWDYCDEDGSREIYLPLANELARQRRKIAQVREEYEQHSQNPHHKLLVNQ